MIFIAVDLSKTSDVITQMVTIFPAMLDLVLAILPVPILVMFVLPFFVSIFRMLLGLDESVGPCTHERPPEIKAHEPVKVESIIVVQKPIKEILYIPKPETKIETVYPGKDMSDLRMAYEFNEVVKKQKIGLKIKVIRKLRRWANS